MTDKSTRQLSRLITLRQLQIFVAVARYGGYTAAANALFLSQPTVSMQIKKLADAIGSPLFEHRGKALRPTRIGRKALEASRDILKRLDQLSQEINALNQEICGELNIAVVTTGKYFMPHLLGAFIHRYPAVQPKLLVTNREKVLQRLHEHEESLLIMGRAPEDLPVRSSAFLDNDLVVVAPADHPLSRQHSIPLRQLLEERLLLREPGSGTRLAMDRLFKEHQLEIEPYMELGSVEAIKQAVMAGLGISVMSTFNLRLELENNKVCILDVEGFPLQRHWYVVYDAHRQLSAVEKAFLDFIHHESHKVLNA